MIDGEIQNYLIMTASRTNGILVRNDLVFKTSGVFRVLLNQNMSFVYQYCAEKGLTIKQRQCYFFCRGCRKKIFRPSNPSFTEGPFCDRKCFGRWRSENRAGAANYHFVSQSSVRQAGQFSRNRLLALERDEFVCVNCGSKHRLQVHHQEEWHPEQEDPHRLDNLITLCQSCHVKLHMTGNLQRAAKASISIRERWAESEFRARMLTAQQRRWQRYHASKAT